MHAEKRPPTRGEWLDLRVHVCLMWQFVAFAGVAAETGGDDVIPSRPPTFVAGGHVVEVQLRFRQHLGAVLAGEFVAQENIAASEFHLQARQAIVNGQNDDFRNPDRDSGAMDHFMIGIAAGIGNP